MSLSNNLYFAYLVKCGLADEAATQLASISGSEYVQLQAQARQMGAGTKAKALVAGKIVENVMERSRGVNSPLWEAAHNLDMAKRVVASIRAAALARVAISAYASDEDVWAEVCEDYRSSIAPAEFVFSSFGSGFDLASDFAAFQEEAKMQKVKSSTMGKSSGFFTKLFG